MQIFHHKNTGLTICQRFFIEKALELLYIGSIDSYRVHLHNPKSIFRELHHCLQEFGTGRIKHFHTIKAKDSKDKKSLIDEVLFLIDQEPCYLQFKSISKTYLLHLLVSTNENNYKKLISSTEILLDENEIYISKVLDGLERLIAQNDYSLPFLEEIDISLEYLFSELISMGYSKYYLYKIVHGIFINSLNANTVFQNHFNAFKNKILYNDHEYEVIFRIDTTQKVYDSISSINDKQLILCDNIDEVSLNDKANRVNELKHFNLKALRRKFIRCKVSAKDYLAALKKARIALSEYLDIINLGLSDEFLSIHNRVLVIDLGSPQNGAFQNNINILDGKYIVEKTHYLKFSNALPGILNNPFIQFETKEKIKSAVRYLRLGNQSVEIEHKFINYWIGLEYIFSNYEAANTINRIKENFICAHSMAYVKRNTYRFKRDFDSIDSASQALISTYSSNNFSCLDQESFYKEIGDKLVDMYPLLSYRAQKLHKWLFSEKKPNADKYLKKHKANLEAHFTRIYRLRNEIIHDAVTDTNNQHITSNLRYYLTYILNELIDFFANPNKQGKHISIEDYFIVNELKAGNLESAGNLLSDLLNVECSIDF